MEIWRRIRPLWESSSSSLAYSSIFVLQRLHQPRPVVNIPNKSSVNILTPFFGDLLIQTDPQSERMSKHFSNTAGNNVWLQNTSKVLSYTCILSKLKKSIFVEKSGCLMFSKEAQWHLPTLGWQSHQGSQLRLDQRKLASLWFWYLDFFLQSNPDNREISFSKFEIWPPWHLLH